LHSEGSCEPAVNDEGQMSAAQAAGGHYDPDNTGRHEGPQGEGHKGDLPVLEVAADGTAQDTLTAPRLTVADARGRALMIHAGGDNYSDEPQPLGGGGARIACGIVD
jgi:Cu-Zn family superoxide dismutase